MKLSVTHTTRYLYAETVSTCHNEVHLAPRPKSNQSVVHHELHVSPAPDFSVSRSDYFGNEVTAFGINQLHQELVITARSEVDVHPVPPPSLGLSPAWEDVPDETRRRNPEAFEAGQFVFESPLIQTGKDFAAWASDSFVPGRRFLDAVNDLSQRIHSDFRYDRRATTVRTPVKDVLEARSGVCQDFAHFMIGCLRSSGLAARYVSGYIRTARDAEPDTLVGGDASHAWVSVYCPPLGWVDFDPTNDCVVDEDHVTLAWGRDFGDVSPLRGMIVGGGRHKLSVDVGVRRVG
jgi:transglutaminase-like putative cysteine protease